MNNGHGCGHYLTLLEGCLITVFFLIGSPEVSEIYFMVKKKEREIILVSFFFNMGVH